MKVSMLGYATSMRTAPTTQLDTAIVNANLGMVAMGAAEMLTEEQCCYYEQKGYQAWIELWIELGHEPQAGECPARWLSRSEKRSAFIRGWIKAKRENDEKE